MNPWFELIEGWLGSQKWVTHVDIGADHIVFSYHKSMIIRFRPKFISISILYGFTSNSESSPCGTIKLRGDLQNPCYDPQDIFNKIKNIILSAGGGERGKQCSV